ncbi:response regulator transcription factor [Streptomyces sp. H27-H1]|uniref:response regulator n=1 Tax=Streptomyces sp. H27-H1 TaxID=2996461 RepID=UPI0022717F10|nr:response regulator transcription factor [Streptomyces sp. H27-H1]MCY0932505.1 response regulator transcription factor [Streptomyces sp. H27-H1]
MITVAVVDDDRMLLEGLRSWLRDVPRIRLVRAVATVDELLAGACAATGETADVAADVVLLDLVLRDDSTPAENISRLRAAGSRVLIISTVADRSRIVAAMAAGACGYLTKDHDLQTLVSALEEVAAGGTVHSPELAFAWAHDKSTARPRLSPKELQVLLDYASGLTLKSTARRAGITPNTAKYYLDRVKEKYQQAGRPAYTKIDLAVRVREDALEEQEYRMKFPPDLGQRVVSTAATV